MARSEALQTVGDVTAARDICAAEEARLRALPAAAQTRMDFSFEAGRELQPMNRRLLTGLRHAWYLLSSVEADLGDPAAGLGAAERSREVAPQLMARDPAERLAPRSAGRGAGDAG